MTGKSSGTAGAEDLRLLRTVAEALGSDQELTASLETMLALVAERLGLRTGWLWLRDDASDRFYLGAETNLPPFLREPVQRTGHSCWCLDSFRAGRLTPENIPVMQCSRLYEAVAGGQVAQTGGLRTHASVPLVFRGQRLGLLNIAGPEWRQLSERELDLLGTVAHQAALAIERARLAEETARLARVEERTHLAREIHDTLAQDLTGIALQIEGARDAIEQDPTRARQGLDRALSRTRESLEQARKSVLSLRAAPLDDQPLPDALRALSRRFAADTGLRVEVRVAEGFPPLPARTEGELFRIAQESLANIRRHATGATQGQITLAVREEQVTLRIVDNGTASESKKQERGGAGGQGIPGMRERARALGGGLRWARRAGKGVTVTAWVPHG